MADATNVLLASMVNPNTVREQQKEIRRLQSEVHLLRIHLGNIYRMCNTCTGHEAVQALINAGLIKEEDLHV